MRDKRAKFIQLANNRVNRAINDLRLIGNLSNRAAYEYDEDDIKKIVRALQRELDSVRSRFADNGAGGEASFSLD